MAALRAAHRPVHDLSVGARCLEVQSTAAGLSQDALSAGGQLAALGRGDGGACEPPAGFVFPWLGSCTVRRRSSTVCHERPVLQARPVQLLPKYELELRWPRWMAIIGTCC